VEQPVSSFSYNTSYEKTPREKSRGIFFIRERCVDKIVTVLYNILMEISFFVKWEEQYDKKTC
jgi:hypothetical protein